MQTLKTQFLWLSLVASGVAFADATPVPVVDRTIPWGGGAGQAGYYPGGVEQLPLGPSAVAVAPDGEVLVVDARNERILGVKSSVRTVATIAKDVEEIAVAPDARLVAFSPLRSSASFYGREGAALGQLAVSRAIRDVETVTLEDSLRLWAHSSLQESMLLGSPTFPQTVGGSLRAKVEGTFRLVSGGRIATRILPGGTGELMVFTPGQKEPTKRVAIAGPATAVRAIGTAVNTACVLVEQVQSTEAQPTLIVNRRVDCYEMDSTLRTLSIALPAPGRFVPRHELAVGGARPRLAWIVAQPNGLRVRAWDIGGAK